MGCAESGCARSWLAGRVLWLEACVEGRGSAACDCDCADVMAREEDEGSLVG